MKGFSITGLCLVLLNTRISALDNGLALTPPMGWLTWERFRCNTDCERDPENCISERLIKEMADIMVSDGYKDVGYEYVIIDDCWLASERDQDGRLVPDPKRFPSGIKKLAEYVHKKGLKFGIYEDFGKKTCGGFPGSEFYMETDAKTFADWGVDYLKFDGCYSNLNDFQAGYEAMGFFLNKTGRKIVYSCEWPFYKLVSGLSVDFAAVRNTCNMWRNYFDIQDSWSSVIDIINFWGNNSKIFTKYAGPGGWNDPDMIILGNFGLSYDEERVHLAMWAMIAAPLIMSNDLRHMRNRSKALLQNRNIISVSQDKLGMQAILLQKVNGIQIWCRKLSDNRTALAFLNENSDGMPRYLKVSLEDMKLSPTRPYNFTEAFEMKIHFIIAKEDHLEMYVNPHGVQLFIAKLM
ncbi:alpha-galactosidase A-like [Saccostrea echinata]|uniref:alpha-galactosidase A-like n=1 Tax=Saccostrea echinata TaxID=191078 RepID=UPI002A82EE7E|nr:alpha-galactosidase A-like [Saccostrea echinata]